MILAFDTYYFYHKAKTVCLAFEQWTDKKPVEVYSQVLEGVAPYTPGEFYRRELPCILGLLRTIDLTGVEAIIVDGFVVLDDSGKPGLGAHLYEALDKKIPVIGVAKTSFATLRHSIRNVLRGNSTRPLYITAIGINLDKAAECIRTMSGAYRIPALLKRLDALTREGLAGSNGNSYL